MTRVQSAPSHASPRHRRRRRRLLGGRRGILLAPLALLALIMCVAIPSSGILATPLMLGPPVPPRTNTPVIDDAPGGEWLSGAFIGKGTDIESIDRMGTWRNRPLDVLTVYPNRGTWAELTSSTWIFTELRAYPGTLLYGLPLVPEDGSVTLADIASGQHDAVFATLADQMRENGRGDTVVRVGWEANGPWFAWGVQARDAALFQAAARRVMQVMSDRTPTLVMSFEVACSTPLYGATDRLAALEDLYPGDDVTDVIGCDHYDNYDWKATSREAWALALRAPDAPGLQDVVDFAREHGKRFAVSEWGLDRTSHGGLDNPLFIQLMHEFFTANADVLAYEAYFDEPAPYIGSSLWGDSGPSLNPRAAAEYVRLWAS